ncbi:MAG TPA: NAD(P)/FAD-dependent oxidoreductase [Candidatus Saccharimonadia bacterium]|nr:NAD(P)/FAD-dependent oxidoreductase [Candidatus Saccharimonadia bacterium]
MSNHTIAVIGGGMAGTAAAHALLRQGHRVIIIEQQDRLGGRIHSHTMGDLTVELGAGFLSSFYTNTLAFLRETRLEASLHPRRSPAYVVKGQIAYGLTNWRTLVGQRWLSWPAKLRLAKEFATVVRAWNRLDLHEPWRAADLDTVSVAEHLGTTTAGRELLSCMAEPLLNGYCYWSSQQTSQATLMLILKTAALPHQTRILAGGLQQIPEAAAQGAEVWLSHQVQQVRSTTDGGYTLTLQPTSGPIKTLSADGIVCATTASQVSTLLPFLTPDQQAFFKAVSYSSTAVVATRVRRSTDSAARSVAYVRQPGRAMGALTVATDLSTTADAIKQYASGDHGAALCAQPDQKIKAQLRSSMAPFAMPPSEAVEDEQVQRWPEAIPHFSVGHLRRLSRFADGQIEDQRQPIVFAGDYLCGPFIEGAFTSGVRAADRLSGRLRSSTN